MVIQSIRSIYTEAFTEASVRAASLDGKLTWLKFMKAFQVEPDGRLKGYNIRTIDDDLDAPWRPKMKKGRPIIFGHFDVIPPESSGPFSHGLLLDYSRSGRGAMAF